MTPQCPERIRLSRKIAEAVAAVYDLKAVNPHRKADVDRRTPNQLLDVVEGKGIEIAEALKAMRILTSVGGGD